MSSTVCKKQIYYALCFYSSVLHYLTLSYTHSHTDSSRLTGENIHCHCEKWSGTDGIRMIETTYNGSHNFPVFLPLPSLVHRLLLSLHPTVPAFLPDHTHRLDASSQPFQCHPLSQFLPKRLRLTGSPTALHKVSQEEKERREDGEKMKGGGKRTQRFCFWCFSPPT